jgi:hypothetical protein
VFEPAKNWDRCEFFVVEISPHDAFRPAHSPGADDLLGCNDDVDSEVVIGLGKLAGNQLPWMDRRRDDRAPIDQPRLDEQRELEI